VEPGAGLPHREPTDVSQRREALIARYRAISLDRLKAIRGKLAAVAEGNAEALGDVRRELHTLKGDSHLLGQVQIGKVAHACEERLLDPRAIGPAVRALGDALEAIKLALHDDAESIGADEALRAALDALVMPASAERRDEPPPPPPRATRPPPPRG